MTTIKTQHLTFTQLLVGTASLAIIIGTTTLAATYISPVLLAFFLAILFSTFFVFQSNLTHFF